MDKNILLIIDDAEVNRAVLGKMFCRTYQIETAENGTAALFKMDKYHDRIVAVLLDILMPEKDGFEVLVEMRSHGYLSKMPVILISASDTNRSFEKGFELGAIDFISKPFQKEEVIRRVENSIELFQYRRSHECSSLLEKENKRYRMMFDMSSDIIFDYDNIRDVLHLSGEFDRIFGAGDVIEHARNRVVGVKAADDREAEELKAGMRSMSPEAPEFDMEIRIYNKRGRVVWFHIYMKSLWEDATIGKCSAIVGKMVDIDRLKVESYHWKDQASRDALTHVNNRLAAKELVYSSIHEFPDEMCAFIFLDVDDFKKVNDQYGHRTGDEVLLYVSSQLQKVFRKTDIIWRIGGDEFAVFARNIPDIETVTRKLEELCEIFGNSKKHCDFECEVTGSIGVALYPKDGADYDTLMSRADKALYFAKETGKNRYSFYDKTKM